MSGVNNGYVSDEEIEKAFGFSRFGDRDHRKLLQQGVLKIQAGYRAGHTLSTIMVELGLLTSSNWNVSAKGKKFIYNAFYDKDSQG